MIGKDWVPFHRRLAKGPKKSLPRGVRFVLLELSLEARPTRGVIDLPLDWGTLDAVHDLLGGDRAEVKRALEAFTKVDDTGVSPIEIVKTSAIHRLKLTKWNDWAGPKSSAERVADYRERKKNGKIEPAVTLHPVTPSNGRNALQTVQTVQTGERDVTSPAPPPSQTETGYDLAWRIWRELWAARYGETYQRTVDTGTKGDDRVLQRVGALALEHGDRAEAVLRLKLGQYFANDNPWLLRNRHPTRVFESDWNKYGNAAPAELTVEDDDDHDDDDTNGALTPEQITQRHRQLDERAAKSKVAREERAKIDAELKRNLAAIGAKS